MTGATVAMRLASRLAASLARDARPVAVDEVPAGCAAEVGIADGS